MDWENDTPTGVRERRERGVDTHRLGAIRAYLEKAGFAYRQDIADLLHIQRKQCALILRRMVERGELAQSGQKYYLPRNEGRKAE